MGTEVKKPEEMTLDELKAAAAAGEQDDVLDNSGDAPTETEVAAPVVEEPEEFLVRREIDLGDGSGVQVFSGVGTSKEAAYEDLADKLAEAQRNATAKIREQGRKLKEREAKDAQTNTDENFVFKQRLESDPRAAIRDLVTEERRAQEEAAQRSIVAQERFVAAHPDYIANPDNGRRITSEVQRLGFNEFTEESLEKAYQSLKSSGLLALKAQEADGSTDSEEAQAERIAQPAAPVPQSRSPKKASTVSTRTSRPVAVTAEPSEDDLYAMPLDKLRKLSNEQLAKNQGA